MQTEDPIDTLLQAVLERPEEQWEAGLEELCARGLPEAGELRRRFDLLRSSGFVGLEPAAPVEPAFPERLGEFQLQERLGQGGMGVVYAARQERLGRTVALKLVRPEQLYFPGARERFAREVTAVAKLSHPGIVSVFSVGDEQGIPYFAMELLRGAGLDEVLRALAGREVESLSGADLWAVVARRSGVATPDFLEGVFAGPWTEVCAGIARRVAEALAHAHQNGVVHRDIKPSNVVVTPEGRVVLLDFGLARPTGVDRVTRAGSHVGSLPYMAPEQLRGESGDARTDVYGLGVLLRELVTLRQPFLSASGETTRRRILQGEGAPLELGNRAASWELATVCAMATEADPRRRYASAADFARDLENVRQHRPIQARPAGTLRRLWRWTERHPALATGLLVGLLALIGTPTAIAIGIAEQRDRARAAESKQQQKAYQANLAAANAALQAHDAAEMRRRLDECPVELRGFEWRHLALALDGSLLTLRGHAGEVRAVDLSRDGTRVSSGDELGEVRLWDVGSGGLLRSFVHHQAAIRQVVFGADGTQLLVGDSDGHNSVIDVATGEIVARRARATPQEHVWIGLDGGCVLASEGGWRMLELDPRTLETRREIALEARGLAPLELFVSDGRRLCALTVYDLHVWDLSSGRELYRIPGLTHGSARALALSAAGDRLAISDSEARITVVDLDAGRAIQQLAGSGNLGALAFDRTGDHLAEVGPDGALRVFDGVSGRLLALQLGHVGSVEAVAFCGARMLIATAGEDRTLRLWAAFGSRDQQVLRGHVGVVGKLAFTPTGAELVSVSRDGSLRTWDARTGMPRSTLPDYPHHVNALDLSADGRTAWSAYHGTLVSTELASLQSAPGWTLETVWIRHLALAPDGASLLAATSTGCSLIDPRGRRVLRELGPQSGPVLCAGFGEAGRVVFTGGEDGRVLRFELESAGAPRTLWRGPSRIVDLAVAHDGRSLFAAVGATLQRLDARDGALAWEQTSSSPLRALVELADGSRVVTGHLDGSVVFWDATSGAPMLVRRLGEFGITSLAADAQGALIAVGGSDGSCHLLWALAPLAPGDVLRVAGTRAATELHAALRTGPVTREEVLAAIDVRLDLDPELRAWLRACESCSLRMSWAAAYASYERVLEPGLAPELYLAHRRVAEVYGEIAGAHNPVALATIALASVRLGDVERALASVADLSDAELSAAGGLQPAMRAARALALNARGRREPALAELERLSGLATAPDATPSAIALWREVEAALAR